MAENLATALAAFQAELPRIGKGNVANAGTYSYRYADLADINEVVLPLLGKHGLSFSAMPTIFEGRFVLAYTLRHAGGERDNGVYPLPDPTKASAQQIGSAITYARRYAFCAVTGIAPGGEDDDGAAAAPASNQPVERHEHSYDPAEQEALRDGFEQEIEHATEEALKEIGARMGKARRSGAMSPATYDHLVKAGAARKAELAEPATVPPPTDRQRQLAAMDRKVEARKAASDGPA